MRIELLLPTLIAIVSAIDINFYVTHENSSLASANLTTLSQCLHQLNTSVDIVSTFDETGTRESHVAVVDEFNDDEQLYSGENQLAIIIDIQDCYREVGITTNIVCVRDHDHLVGITAETATIAANLTHTYSKPGTNSRFSHQHLFSRANGANSRGVKPIRRLDLGFLIYQGAALLSSVLSRLFEIDCGVCYSLPGAVGSGIEFINAQEFEVDFMFWPHHCCRSRSPDGSDHENGQIMRLKADTDNWANIRIGSIWLQCSTRQGWPNPDTGSEDADPCVTLPGRAY